MKTQSLKYFRVKTLTFHYHVMSSVTHVTIGLGVGTFQGLRGKINATLLSHLSMTSFSQFSSSTCFVVRLILAFNYKKPYVTKVGSQSKFQKNALGQNQAGHCALNVTNIAENLYISLKITQQKLGFFSRPTL